MSKFNPVMFPNLSLTIGSLKITPFFWSLVLAAVISSFSIWRRLKEDFQEEVIFEMTLAAIGSAFVFGRFFFVLFHLNDFGFSLGSWLGLSIGENFSLAGAFIGAVGIIYWQIIRLKQNPWEFLDALTLPFLYFFTLGGGGSFLTDGNLWHLSFLVLGIMSLLSYPWLKKKYRSFTWYPSGKTGFLIAFFGLVIFPILILLAFVRNGKVYLNELVLLFLALICLGVLYYRSERDPQKDLKNLFKGRV
jgi:hypothetical protein